MQLLSFVGGLAGLSCLVQAGPKTRDYSNNDYYVLHLDRNIEPTDIARRLGLEHQGQLGGLIDHHIFCSPKTDDDIVNAEIKKRREKGDINFQNPDVLDGIFLSQKQKPQQRLESRLPVKLDPFPTRLRDTNSSFTEMDQILKDLEASDPIFKSQWHLFNKQDPGQDINVTGVWQEGINGKNVTVAIVDDGLEWTHRDLVENYCAEGSWDFNENSPNPGPKKGEDRHGTRAAGLIAATRNNSVCGVGVAYDAKVSGIRFLGGDLTQADEAEAMTFKPQVNDIYSCSWGPEDDGQHMVKPGVLVRRAMHQSMKTGRNGLGSIYVFASGNGAPHEDNCNFDGYTNSIYTITVAAVDRKGLHPPYSERCSANLVASYSSGSCDWIHTTEVRNQCFDKLGGTSASAPIAAGMFALVLQVRPDLSWRDLQYLVVNTAVQDGLKKGEWQKTATGKKFSHNFGYGKLDAYALVQKAKEWKSVKPQTYFFSPILHVNKAIPEHTRVSATFEVSPEMLKEANMARVEHVTVTMNVEHGRRGDLSVDLFSPQGVVSRIATSRKADDFPGGYKGWTFMSVAHWGELGVGKWTIDVRDLIPNGKTGTFVDWRLELWGESIDADNVVPLPIPADGDAVEYLKEFQYPPLKNL